MHVRGHAGPLRPPLIAASSGGSGGSCDVRRRSQGAGALSPIMELSHSASGLAPATDGAELVRPKTDDHLYRFLTLPNGLRALLVSDATADKAAAAVDVSGEAGGFRRAERTALQGPCCHAADRDRGARRAGRPRGPPHRRRPAPAACGCRSLVLLALPCWQLGMLGLAAGMPGLLAACLLHGTRPCFGLAVGPGACCHDAACFPPTVPAASLLGCRCGWAA